MTKYNNPKVGCYVDESSGSADDCNSRTIKFAEGYGFVVPLFTGRFDGLRGSSIEMSLDDALSASHQGECDADVEALASKPEISAQLDAIGAETIRAGMKETGAWDETELADGEANRLRAVWISACDIKEDHLSEQLSSLAEEAIEYLNEQETRPYMYWTHEDNSLYLTFDMDSAREDVDFVSGQGGQDYPNDEYRGEWLHISDHGNATLYIRNNRGEDREVWSVT